MRSDRARHLIALVILTCVLPARADEVGRDPAGAEVLFAAGKRLLQSGDWASACDKFEKSLALDPAVSTLVKTARCRERDGKLTSAWYQYEQALKLNRELTPTSERRRRELDELIQSAIAALEPRIAKLRIIVTPAVPTCSVRRDGEEIPPAVLGEALPVDPGDHTVTVSAPNYETARRTVHLAEGEGFALEIALVAGPSPMASRSPETARTPEPSGEPKGDRGGPVVPPRSAGPDVARTRVALALGVAGFISGGFATYFGIHTLALVSESNPKCNGDVCSHEGVELRDRARTAQTTAFVLAGAGAVLAGGAAVIYFTAPGRSSRSALSSPSLLVTAGGISGRVTW